MKAYVSETELHPLWRRVFWIRQAMQTLSTKEERIACCKLLCRMKLEAHRACLGEAFGEEDENNFCEVYMQMWIRTLEEAEWRLRLMEEEGKPKACARQKRRNCCKRRSRNYRHRC